MYLENLIESDRNKTGNSINTKSLTIYHQNIRSLKYKKDELSLFLTEECHNPDVVCITKHHMDPALGLSQHIMVCHFAGASKEIFAFIFCVKTRNTYTTLPTVES
jgi:hypothetical protein